MRRAFLSASLVLGFLASAPALAQVTDGTCTGPSCPFWIADVDAAANAADDRPCAVEPDPALAARFRAGKRLTHAEFIRFVAPMAQKSEQLTGVPASVTIAQAVLETGYGASARLVANNLFGIKGNGTAGNVKLWTREYVHGNWVKVRAKFAAFNEFDESVAAHGRLISGNRIYARAMAVKDQGPQAFARALQRCGYATDPRYANKLIALMKERDLEQYDGSKSCSA